MEGVDSDRLRLLRDQVGVHIAGIHRVVAIGGGDNAGEFLAWINGRYCAPLMACYSERPDPRFFVVCLSLRVGYVSFEGKNLAVCGGKRLVQLG